MRHSLAVSLKVFLPASLKSNDLVQSLFNHSSLIQNSYQKSNILANIVSTADETIG
jgi:hypothetical protein